jgi:hypothetical protein
MRRFGRASAVLIAAQNQSATRPSSVDGFAAGCRRQVGFPGASPYSQAPGVHPIELFAWDADFGDFQHWIMILPAKWTVKDETEAATQRDLERLELVACQKTISTSQTGKVCQFQGDGEEVKLDLLIAQDELTVYEAATGAQVASLPLPQPRPICPTLWMPDEGDMSLVLTPDTPAIRARSVPS